MRDYVIEIMNLREDYHVHTNYNDHSDSDLTVKNVVEEAERKGLEIIALTEHVRESSKWISGSGSHSVRRNSGNFKRRSDEGFRGLGQSPRRAFTFGR